MENPFASRTTGLAGIRKAIQKKRIHGLLVTDINNIRYLTGFSGSSGCALVTGKENVFITDFRYKTQSLHEITGWEILIEKGDRIPFLKNLARKYGIRKLGFESSVSYRFSRDLSRTGLRLYAFEGLIEGLREIKSAYELQCIQEAVARAEGAFLDVKPYIKRGVKERSLALRLEERLKRRGCSCIPFDIIVASGPNSALPHAKPAERKLAPGDLLIMDWGGEAHGYFSDMTRTFLLRGTKNIQKKRDFYHTVLEANRKAVSAVSDGVRSKKIDSAARDYIKNAGYGEFFGHGTGHGVGLQVHESPRISWNKSQPVRENMIFTIEPGIYVPGIGGVRIEDMVVVKQNGCKVLTGLSRKLELL